MKKTIDTLFLSHSTNPLTTMIKSRIQLSFRDKPTRTPGSGYPSQWHMDNDNPDHDGVNVVLGPFCMNNEPPKLTVYPQNAMYVHEGIPRLTRGHPSSPIKQNFSPTIPGQILGL